MIDINLYRSRIGNFRQSSKNRIRKLRKIFRNQWRENDKSGVYVLSILQVFVKILLIFVLLQPSWCLPGDSPALKPVSSCCLVLPTTACQQSGSGWKGMQLRQHYVTLSKQLTPNYQARYLHGNGKRGILNIHVNIRSLFNKMSEVKNLIQKEKPHILGISEAELRKSHHCENSLKVPGYDLLLPKSWDIHGKARLVVYVKKGLVYEHLHNLEHPDVQSIWIKAGFKNTRQVYYSHVYREHTNTMGGSMAAQRTALEKMLGQWEDAVVHGNHDTPNEVHIAGDMNLDSLKGRWLEPNYSLVGLARMVLECCNTNNFTQMVDKVTRIQYDSIRNKTASSCIDHVYCNAKHRISVVKVVTCGTSDHDAIAYTRFSKEPKPPARTIRKRSYKNFKKDDYLKDVASIDFTDVYCCTDVDDAAALLTAKLVDVLNIHAPWIIFQQRKHFVPWLTPETIKLMEERDQYKEQAKVFISVSLMQQKIQLGGSTPR